MVTMTKEQAQAECDRLWNLSAEEKRKLWPDFKSFNKEYCKYAEIANQQDK